MNGFSPGLGELNNQNCAFGRQANQHDQPDFGIQVIIERWQLNCEKALPLLYRLTIGEIS